VDPYVPPKINIIAPDDSMKMLQALRASKASSIRSNSAFRRGTKKVEFADSLNERLQDNSFTSGLHFGTNRSIRRVKEAEEVDIPNFTVDLTSNADDILQ
jgi:hypothetical protein